MKRIWFILTVILFASCCACSQKPDQDEYVSYTERLGLDNSILSSSHYLAVLMNRELTDKTLFVINPVYLSSLHSEDRFYDLKYNFYHAMMQKQAGNYRLALIYLLMAEAAVTEDSDNTVVGMLYTAKKVIRQHMNDYVSAVDCAITASEYFAEAGNDYQYYDSLLEVARCYVVLGRYEEAAMYASMSRPGLEEFMPFARAKYWDTLLNIYKKTAPDRISDTIESLKEDVPSPYVYWLNVAQACSIIGQTDSAVVAIDRYRRYEPDYEDNLAYHGVAVDVLKSVGMYQEAVESYELYVNGIEKVFLQFLQSGIMSIEWQHETEQERIRARHVYIFSGLSVLMALSFACMIWYMMRVRLRRKQEELSHYSALVAVAEEEVKRLKAMYDSKTMDPMLREAVMERLSVFNSFTLSRISPNYSDKSALEELKSMIDSKDSFLDSTCRTFEVIHPKFIAFLVSCGLTERERGCCCLYCMGMRGNEIASYLGLTDQSYYNFSSILRKKLGMKEYKTNLDFFLRDKLKELD